MFRVSQFTPRVVDDIVRTETQIRRDRELANALAELGLTHVEAALFNVIHFGLTLSPPALADRATCRDYSFGRRVTFGESELAVAACLEKGWLQIIDESALGRIGDELRRGKFLGPIYGFPEIGAVDFTSRGAELWINLCHRALFMGRRKPYAYEDVVHEKTSRFFSSRAAAVAEIEAVRGVEGVSVSEPVSIGPWRANWWQRFPEGFRVDVEERRRWQGHATSDGESYWPGGPDRHADRAQLRDILEQHNVRLAEWLVLEQVELGYVVDSRDAICAEAARNGKRRVGVAISEEECREGLEACLRFGRLRVLDQAAVDEVYQLLDNDSAVLALPKTARLFPKGGGFVADPSRPGELIPKPPSFEDRFGTFDFTESGASLYRMMRTEWLGPAWEDQLSVANCHFWEEHHYCESLDGFERIEPEHSAKGNAVQAKRVIPIGPWCVFWWERFPSGYRLELEVSQS